MASHQAARSPDHELKIIEESFHLSLKDMKKIVKDFHSEMEKGLSGRDSSLKMIPAYVDRPTGNEKGKFIALDIGGTNFRILEAELKGGGSIARPASRKFAIDKRHMTAKGEYLFDFIAECVKIFIKEKKMPATETFGLGFTFSFPVEQTGIASGTLLRWTKGFAAKGVIGEDVVRLLNDALARKGVGNVRVAALANDTVGTLAAESYKDRTCDVGVILGTGTNACYEEDISKIKKWQGPGTGTGKMIINTEWGNFNKLKVLSYDRQLNRESENPGSQILEKMVSGMYLGELTRLIIKDFIKRRLLFGGANYRLFDNRLSFKTEYMSAIEADRSGNLSKVLGLFNSIGIKGSTLADRRYCRRVCEIISRRAARISAAALAAVITKIDTKLAHRHTVAIDGSVYEKYPGFSGRMRSAMREMCGRAASHIEMVLAKDGSGKGAAVIAAVAEGL